MVTAHGIPGITKKSRKNVIVARMVAWGSQPAHYAPAPAPAHIGVMDVRPGDGGR